MRSRVTSGRFIGRDVELAELQSAVGAAWSGRPALLLLGGEAGVGKSRLTAELERSVAQTPDPPVILHGDAVPPSEGELPFAALLGALRPLVREGHPGVEGLTDTDRAQLTTLLPALGPSPAGGGPVTRLRLFESLLALLEMVCGTAPVLLVLEDVHWADRSTLGFVDFLVRSMRDERLAVLLTYRTDELHRGHPLRPLLSELHRHGRARRIELAPFDRDELAAALREILGTTPDPAVLGRVLARSEGNPLYAEELLAASVDGRGTPPESLSDAFLARAERLGPAARRLTRAIAVGRALDESALTAVSELSGGELADALREAVAAQVLVPEAPSAFRFRHALLREAVYADLLPGERGALHLALAHHLEAGLGDASGLDVELERALQVAAHFHAAGDQPSALRADVRAGTLARRAQAYDQAADRLAQALELWPRVPDAATVAATTHTQLLIDAGTVHTIAGRDAHADALLTQALGELEADTGAGPDAQASVLLERAQVLVRLHRDADAVAVTERVLELTAGDDLRPGRIEAQAGLAQMRLLYGHLREARHAAEATLAVAASTGNLAAEIELRMTLGAALTRLGEFEPGLAESRRSLTLAQEAADEVLMWGSAISLALALGHVGAQSEGVEVLRAALDATPRSRVHDRQRVSLQLAHATFRSGEWTATRNCLDAVDGRGGALVGWLRHAREAELAAGVGELERARVCLEATAEVSAAAESPMTFALHAALDAEVRARAGELTAAARVVADTARRLADHPEDAARASDVHLVGARVHADRAQRARDLGDAAGIEEAIERAGEHVAHLEALSAHNGVFGAQILEARAHLARARAQAGAEDWSGAAAAWDALEMPYPAAAARLREAECRLHDDDRETAAAVIAGALEAADRLGSRWLSDELRGLAERSRLRLPDDRGAPADADAGTASRSADEDPFELTDREHQVLAELAEGRTNRQIGETLFISDKTVSAHVSRILAKLDVHGRTEAAAVAHRLGLTAPAEDR